MVIKVDPAPQSGVDAAGGRLSRVWHGALALLVLVTFVVHITLLLSGGADANSGTDTDSVGLATRFVRMFSYFTIQSNVLILVAAATLAIHPHRDGRLWRILRLDALLGIVITGLVFATVLAGDVALTGVAVWVNAGFHYVAPWGALIGWVLFGPRPRIDWRTYAFAFVWPVLWIVYTFVHGAISDWYPYPFLDVNVKGYGTALANTGVVAVFGLVIALLFKAFDRLRTIDR